MKNSEGPRHSRRRIIIAAVGLALVGASAAVAGTVSAFTLSQSKTQSVATGTFVFTLADPGAPGAAAPFSVNISGMAPGDFGDRLVNVVNGGSTNYSSIALAVTAPTTSSALDTDATNGLALAVDECSVAWTQASTSVGATCSGTLTSRTTSTPVSTLKTTGPTYSTGLVALTGNSTSYLRFHYALPSASTGTSGLTSVLNFTFSATQSSGNYH